MESLTLLVLVLDSTLRLSAPLILAALAGLFSERSGIIDIGLEGKMLGAAFAAAAVAALTGSPWAGLAAGIGASMLLALVHGYACITHRGNQVVSGLALNILVSGLTAVLGIAWFAQGGRTPQLPGEARFLPLEWPGAAALREVPGLGAVYSELLSGHNLIVYLAFLAVPAAAWGSTGPASGCVCEPPARTRTRWTRRGSRSWGCLSGTPVHRRCLRGGRGLPVARPERRVHQRGGGAAGGAGAGLPAVSGCKGRTSPASARCRCSSCRPC